jgi:hypothetical protein
MKARKDQARAAPRALAGALLLLSVAGLGPNPAAALADTPHLIDPETLAAAAEAEGRRNRALARIDRVIVELGAAERRALADQVAERLLDLLRPTRQALDAAKLEVANAVSPWDAVSSASRERKLRRALEVAGLERSLESLPLRLRERLGSDAAALYDRTHAQLAQILREEIAAALGPRAGTVLFDDLSRRLGHAAALRLDAAARPAVGSVETAALALPLAGGAAAIAARRAIASGLGPGLAARALGRAGTAAAMSPGKATGVGVAFDVAVGAVALAVTLAEAGALAREAMNGQLDRWYAEQIERPLLDGDAVAAGMAAGVAEQLRADRAAAAHLVERTYAGVVEQARSPGFAAFAARADDAALGAALQLVPRVFGAEFVELDYGLKLDLARRLASADEAHRLVRRHGQSFVELFRADPPDTAAVANATDAPRAFAHILAAALPAEELLAFRRAAERLGALDGPQTAALVLVRTALPELPVERIRADGLARVAAAMGALDGLATDRPAVLHPIVGWLLDGALPPGLLARLAHRPDGPALAGALAALGPARFEAILGAAGPRDLGAYLAEVPGALEILRADGPGSLRFYQLAEGGGVRAVLSRERLRREAGGRIGPMAEGALVWLLARTDLPADRIGLGVVRDLQALGIPGPLWPDAVAVPAAGLLARGGGLALPFGVLLLLASAPLLAWWTRLFPRRRGRRAAAAVAVAPSQPGPDRLWGRRRDGLPAP